MKKKFCAVLFVSALILSGCGMNDTLYKQVKKEVSFSNFTSTDIDLWKAARAEEKENLCVYEAKKQQVQEFLKKTDEQFPETHFQLYFPDAGKDANASDWQKLNQIMEKSIRNYDGSDAIEGSQTLYEEDMKRYLAMCEDLGYAGVSRLMDKDAEWPSTVVSRGVKFCMSVYPEGEWNAYDDYENGGKNGGKLVYNLEIKFSNLFGPKKYMDILENQAGGGFFASSVIQGGYVDRIHLQSSYDHPDIPYNKVINYYLKDGEPVQLETDIERHKDADGKPVFDEREKQGMTSLLAHMSGDEAAAETFVENFDLSGEKEGIIGSCRWQWKKVKYNVWKLIVSREDG